MDDLDLDKLIHDNEKTGAINAEVDELLDLDLGDEKKDDDIALDLDIDLDIGDDNKEDQPATPPPSSASRTTSVRIIYNSVDPQKIPFRLQTFATNIPDVYYIRQINYITPKQERKPAVLVLSRTAIFIFHDIQSGNPEPALTINISSIFGLILQPLLVTKLFMTREEAHVLVQTENEGEGDLFFSFPPESEFISSSEDQDPSDISFVKVLRSLSLAVGGRMHIARLKESESIERLYLPLCNSKDEIRLRRRHAAALEMRTKYSDILNALRTEGQMLHVQIETLRATPAGHALSSITASISQLKAKIQMLEESRGAQQQSKAEAEKKFAKLTAALQLEADRRSKAVKSVMEAQEAEAVYRQVSEYQQLRNAHSREMGRLQTLIAFNERRLNDRTKGPVDSVQALTQRIEVLSAEERYASSQASACRDLHARQLQALAAAKSTVAEGKQRVSFLAEEVKNLRQIKDVMMSSPTEDKPQLPHHCSRNPPDELVMPQMPRINDVVSPSLASPTKRATNIDSDDDLGVPAPGVKAPPKVVLDSDDEVDIPAPSPKPAINLDDDDDI